MDKFNFKQIDYLTNSGEYEKALEIIDQELKIHPQNFEAWWAKGKTISMSVVKTTAGSLNVTTENLPQNSVSKLSWFHNALRCFDEALKLKPDYDKAYESKSLTLSRMDKKKEAIECGLRVIEINPKNFVTLINLAKWYNDLLDFDNGLKYADKILAQKYPLSKDELAIVYFNKAQSQFNQNDSDFKNSMALAIQFTTNHSQKNYFKEHLKELMSYNLSRDPYE